MNRIVSITALLAATLAVTPATAGNGANPPPVPLEGGYVIYWSGQAYGCQVVANGDGTFTLYNERPGHGPATAKPISGNPYKYVVDGWSPDCRTFTIVVSSSSVSLLFENHTEWIRPR